MLKSKKYNLKKLVVLIGLPRAASTSIFFFLSRSRGFEKSINKEKDIFWEKNFKKIQAKFYINDNDKSDYIIDSNSSYILSLDALKKIAKLDKKIPIIICLREPKSWIEAMAYRCKRLNFIKETNDIFKKFTYEKGNSFLYKDGTIQQRINFVKKNFKNILFFDYSRINEKNYIKNKLEFFFQRKFDSRIITKFNHRKGGFISWLMSVKFLKPIHKLFEQYKISKVIIFYIQNFVLSFNSFNDDDRKKYKKIFNNDYLEKKMKKDISYYNANIKCFDREKNKIYK